MPIHRYINESITSTGDWCTGSLMKCLLELARIWKEESFIHHHASPIVQDCASCCTHVSTIWTQYFHNETWNFSCINANILFSDHNQSPIIQSSHILTFILPVFQLLIFDSCICLSHCALLVSSRFKFCLHHLLALWPWEVTWILLGPSILVYKMG